MTGAHGTICNEQLGLLDSQKWNSYCKLDEVDLPADPCLGLTLPRSHPPGHYSIVSHSWTILDCSNF